MAAEETVSVMLGEAGGITNPDQDEENNLATIAMNKSFNAATALPSMAGVKNDNQIVNRDSGEEESVAAGKIAANGVAPNAQVSAKDESRAGGETSTPTINNEPQNNASVEMPLSTPRRRIKKRREDGFVYAEDARAEKSARLHSKQPTLSSNTGLPKKRLLKRPRKCPSNDSILIEVPLSVTADLGVAMRRTRRKRIKRIKHWVASGIADSISNTKSSPDNPASEKEDGSRKKDNKVSLKRSALVHDIYEELDESDEGPRHRNQYGSMVDYLEAKYVRGVMIEGYDEREYAKNKRKTFNNDESDEGKQSDVDSDRKGSCYESDGWIDDSLLHEEVAGQVIASSAYGMTQIEKDARRRKEDKRKREKGEDRCHDKTKKLEWIDESGGEDGNSDKDQSEEGDSTADLDFDDGFFVNLGDLEMAEGWNCESDFVISLAKKNVRKRVYSKRSSAKLPKLMSKCKNAKEKNVYTKLTISGEKKRLLKEAKCDGKKTGFKKKVAEDGKTLPKTKKVDDGKTVTKKKPEDGKSTDEKKVEHARTTRKSDHASKKCHDDSSWRKKKKKKPTVSVTESSTSPEKNEDTKEASVVAATEAAPDEKQIVAPDKGSNHEFKVDATLSPKVKKAPEMSKKKEKATHLRKLYKRKYNVCMKQIKEMTTEELPRKQKKKSMVKVSVNIPPDRSIGHEITFANPNVPGQKLKVKIPKKADMEKRCFVVSVPAPKVKEPELRENNFPKEFKESLHSYSCAYDDWCVAEGEYNDSLPTPKRKEFKPTTEKLKKFDEMVKELPKNLATPIDASYLRKIVRQERSNKTRREKRKDGGSTAAWELKQEESEINIPHKGTNFPSIVFHKQDFR